MLMNELFENYLKEVGAGRPIIFEGGVPIQSPEITKVSAKYINADPDLTPISIEIECNFSVTFDGPKIAQDFQTEQSSDEEEEFTIDNDEDAYDTNVVDKTQVQDKPIKPNVIVDYDAFKYDVIMKNFPTYKVDKKLKDYIRSGQFKMGDFEITAFNYSTQVSDKVLADNFEKYDKKNKSQKKLKFKFGYAIAIEAKSRTPYSKKEIKDFATSFVSQFQKFILVDTDYYTFSK
jgi:hypothetical protein